MADRQALFQVRYWCPVEKTHQDDPDCGWDHDGKSHRLRKRRMAVCSVCEQGYFTRREFDKHECWSAY